MYIYYDTMFTVTDLKSSSLSTWDCGSECKLGYMLLGGFVV